VRRRWVNSGIFTQGLPLRTCFFVLGLISSTTQGAEILEDYKWMSSLSPLGTPTGVCLPDDLEKFIKVGVFYRYDVDD